MASKDGRVDLMSLKDGRVHTDLMSLKSLPVHQK